MPRRRDVTLGSLIQLVVRVAGMVSGALVAALQARTLSVAEFGVLSTIFSLNAMAIILNDVGMMNTSIRKLAAAPERRSEIVSGLLTSRFLLGLLLALVGIGASAFFLDSADAVWTAVLIFAALPLGALTATQAISQAKLQFAAVNSLLMLQNFLWLTVVAGLALLEATLPLFALGFLICALVQGTTTWLLCGKGLDYNWRAGLSEAWILVKEALPLGIGSLAVTAYYRLTGVVLFAHSGPEAAGNFSAAFRFLDVLQAIPATLSTTLIPIMSRSIASGDSRKSQLVWGLSLKLLLAASVITAIVVALLAEQIVQLLYGNQYVESPALLRTLMFAFPAVCLGWLLTGVITSMGRVREYSLVTCLVCGISIVASLKIIPVFGARGAAWVTVGTEALTVVLLAFLVYKFVKFRVSASMLARILVAGAITATFVTFLRPYGLVWPLTIGGVSAIGSIMVVGLVTRRDFELLLHRSELE